MHPVYRFMAGSGLAISALLAGCTQPAARPISQPAVRPETVAERAGKRTFPSVFQAWNPIDMADVPLDSKVDRLRAAARHDLLWEEPVSQLGSGVKLVLGAVWGHAHGGLATCFTAESRRQAIVNREHLLALNPNMVFLMEIRWKDAPGSYLPAESAWWKRSADAKRTVAWAGAYEPYYYLDHGNPAFQRQIARQAQIALESGVYDGIMLDWWGSHGEIDPACIAFLRNIRRAMGAKGLIVVNNDRIAPLPGSAPLINGAFMEITPSSHNDAEAWQTIKEQLIWFEQNVARPAVNCLEIQTGTPADMRAGLALSLVFSDGYYLFAQDGNKHPAPDHLHDWFPIYDVDLGRPTGTAEERDDGAAQRAYEHGRVVYNPLGNTTVGLVFETDHRRASNNRRSRRFSLAGGDGDLFLREKD